MNLLIIYITLAIGVSFLCSILEAVILSISPNYLESLKDKEPAKYKKLLPLRTNIEKPLASILTINTFAHTIGAAGAGAQALEVFGNEWIATFSVVLTLGILFLSEIIPKSIGAQYAKSLAGFAAKVLPPMIALTYPLVYISELLSKLFSKSDGDKTSRDEIKAIVDIGLRDGALEKSEYTMLKNSLEFKKVPTKEVMTKRAQVVGLTIDETTESIREHITENNFSRIPIFGLNHDDIKGYALKNDLLQSMVKGEEIDLNQCMKPMLIVPSYLPLKKLFYRLLERREHICAVVDDYGKFVGIVTLENIIENLLGLEIEDEFDSP